MGTIYFLVFVAVCAVAFVVVIGRSNRRQRKRPDMPKVHAPRHTTPLHRHRTAGHALLHSHDLHGPSEAHDIWHTRRQHAAKERWEPGSSITASRIRSDDEPERGEDDEMSMGVIEYTPEDVTPTGGRKRGAR